MGRDWVRTPYFQLTLFHSKHLFVHTGRDACQRPGTLLRAGEFEMSNILEGRWIQLQELWAVDVGWSVMMKPAPTLRSEFSPDLSKCRPGWQRAYPHLARAWAHYQVSANAAIRGRTIPSGFSWPCHLLAELPWTKYPTQKGLSFVIYEMAIAVPIPQGCCKGQIGSCRVIWPILTQDDKTKLH